MPGCFGNHPFDRQMERELYRYLADCDDYEQLCEKICQKIPDDLWDKYDDVANRIIDKYIAPRVERGVMTLETAQNVIAKLIIVIDANKKYKIF